MTHVPVVVIGAGPTGATAAIMLAQRGIRCLVLERWPEVYPLPRAVQFDDEVFRILAGLGLAEELRAISRPATGMQLVDPRLRVLAEFTRDPHGGAHGYPQANMFDQPDLERVLRARVADLRVGVEVIAIDQGLDGPAPVRVRYRDAGTGAETDVWADAVLGCDGANSLTRASIGAGLEDLGFTQEWMVVDVSSPSPLHPYAGVQQVCDADRAATFMMVTPGRYRWEFRLHAGDLDIVERIRPWLGSVAPSKLTFLRDTPYTFRGAIASRWRDRRVFLLGDAAHLTPPFIGQGMCAGIRDAANLTWKLALVLTGRADERLLISYEHERRPHARRMIHLAMLVGWLMTGGSARTARLRRAALRTLTRLPGVERRVMDNAWPALPAGPLTARRDRVAGRLCPQPRIRTAQGSEVRLDDALGDGFAVVSRSAAAFDLDAPVLHLGPGGIVDLDGTLTALLDAARSDALLVRPDRVVAASTDPRGWRNLLESAGIPVPRAPK